MIPPKSATTFEDRFFRSYCTCSVTVLAIGFIAFSSFLAMVFPVYEMTPGEPGSMCQLSSSHPNGFRFGWPLTNCFGIFLCQFHRVRPLTRFVLVHGTELRCFHQASRRNL